MVRIILIGSLAVFVASFLIFSFVQAQTADQNSGTCLPGERNFFRRIGCVINAGVDAIIDLFGGKEEVSVPPSLTIDADDAEIKAITENVQSISQEISSLDLVYDTGGVATREALLQILKKRSEERKKFMLDLVEKDTLAFLQNTLPSAITSGFPSEIQGNFEQEVSITGRIEVLHFDDFDKQESREEYFIQAGTERLQFFPVGSLPSIISGTTVRLNNSFRIGASIAAVVADNTFKIIQPASAEALGEQKTLFFLINFLDSSPPVFSREQAEQLIFNGQFQNFFKEASYNQMFWSGDVLDWYTYQRNGEVNAYCQSPDTSDPELIDILNQNNKNIADYDRVVFIADHRCLGGGMSGVGKWSNTIGGNEYQLSISWIGSVQYALQPSFWGAQPFSWTNLDYLLSHELGHALGVMHANSWECGADNSLYGENCQHIEYGNYYDVMGANSYSLHFNAFFKEIFGWFDEASKLVIDRSGRYNLAPLTANSGLRLAKIQALNTDYIPFYLEYRRGVGFNSRLNESSFTSNQSGLFVNNPIEPDSQYPFPRLLDMSPVSSSYEDWSQVTLNDEQIFSDLGLGITIGPVISANDAGITFDAKIEEPTCINHNPSISNYGPYYLNKVPRGQTTFINFLLINTDSPVCDASDFRIEVTTPSNWGHTISPSEILTLQVGGQLWINIALDIPADAEPGSYQVTTKVVNETLGLSAVAGQSTFLVIAPIEISLDPSTPLSGEIPAGERNALFTKVKLSAGASEAFISGFLIFFDVSPPVPAQLDSIKVYNGATLLSQTEKFDNPFLFIRTPGLFIPANSSKVLDLRADISAAANSSVSLGLLFTDFPSVGKAVGNSMKLNPPSFFLLSPNGGERWMIQSSKNFVRWDPDPPDWPEIKAYLEMEYEGGFATTVGEMLSAGNGSIQWYGDVGRYGNYPEPGDGYYVRVENAKTGESDRSDAPFTILPADYMKVDLKVNGSDGPVQLPERTKNVKISWISENADTCVFYGNELGGTIPNLPPSGKKIIAFNENTFGGSKWVSLWCTSPIGDRDDSVEVQFLKSLDIPKDFSATLEFTTSTGTPTAQVALRWTDTSAEENGFEIWRSPTSGKEKFYSAVGADRTKFTDDEFLRTGETRYYRVAAFQVQDKCFIKFLRLGCQPTKILSDFSNEAAVTSGVSAIDKITPGGEIRVPREGFINASVRLQGGGLAPKLIPKGITDTEVVFEALPAAQAGYKVDVLEQKNGISQIKVFEF